MKPSSHLILCCPLLLLTSIPPSIRVYSNESTLCMRWPKYWRFNLSISPSNEHPELITFSMHWLDLFAVQGTLKSLLQYRSSKASILWRLCLNLKILYWLKIKCTFGTSLVDRNLPANTEDMGSIPSPGRSYIPRSN